MWNTKIKKKLFVRRLKTDLCVALINRLIIHGHYKTFMQLQMDIIHDNNAKKPINDVDRKITGIMKNLIKKLQTPKAVTWK